MTRSMTLAAVLLLLLSPAISARTKIKPYITMDGVTANANGKVLNHQGISVSNGYLFCLEDGGHALVFKDKAGKQKPVGHFDIESSAPDQHANCINFGVEYAPGADFPLLYITNGRKNGAKEFICYVESISLSGKGRNIQFHNRQVQAITVDTTAMAKHGLVQFFGCPSWQVDDVRGYLWVFSAVQRTTPAVTKEYKDNKYIATKYRLPKLSEGKEVTLTYADVLDQVVLEYDTHFTQGGCMRDGKIYFCFGTADIHNTTGKTPQRIRVYNTDTKEIEDRIELHGVIPEEPEDMAISGNKLLLNTNSPIIYQLPSIL